MNPVLLLAAPALAIFLTAERTRGHHARWGCDGLAMGAAVLGHPAVDCDRAIAVPENLARPLRQDRRRLDVVDAVTNRIDLWRARDARGLRARHARRVSKLHRAAIRALHGRGRYSSDRHDAWYAMGKHRDAGARDRDCEHRRNHRRGHDPIRPLIRPNEARQHNAHVIIFFIILVANVGGALTPLGDPPLFVGFLHGVDFFWTAQHVWMQTAIVATLLLATFFFLDLWRSRRDAQIVCNAAVEPIRVPGSINFLLIALIVAAILLSATWDPEINFDIYATKLTLQNVVRDAALVLIAMLSLWLTADEDRAANGFTWKPIKEVAKLFAGIFVAIIPGVGHARCWQGWGLRGLLSTVSERDGAPHEVADFWLTGILSAVLDNAPTYLGSSTRRRRCTREDGLACRNASVYLDGGGLHGGADLHRQCAELHGQCDCNRTRGQNA